MSDTVAYPTSRQALGSSSKGNSNTTEILQSPKAIALSGRIADFKPYKGATTLRGFLDINLPDLGLELRGLMVHEKNGSRWLAIPSVPQKAKDGTIKTGP